jgi:hypothetical protein
MRFLFLFLLLSLPLSAQTRLGLSEGEKLTYRVSWGLFGKAGIIDIGTHQETNDGRPCTVVITTTSTSGFLSKLFRFEARSESVYDNATGRMIVHTETSAGGRKKTNIALAFDYADSTASFTDFMNSDKNQIVPVPAGSSPKDLIMSLVATRLWDLKPGDQRDMYVIFEDEIYDLTVHALQYEEVETRLGKFTTLVLEPRMEKSPPLGMFKRGSTVRVWIAQDERRLPVKFQVEFAFGAGVATLVDYQPPSSAVSDSSSADAATSDMDTAPSTP